jgi:hypothetical protein
MLLMVSILRAIGLRFKKLSVTLPTIRFNFILWDLDADGE